MKIIDGIIIPTDVVRGAHRRDVIHDDPCAEWEVEGRVFTAREITEAPYECEGPQVTSIGTHELQLGDVVLTDGMRVKLDTEPVLSYTNWSGRPTYSWVGEVENLAEVIIDRVVPLSWLTRDGLPGRWNVQGNDLARWYVER